MKKFFGCSLVVGAMLLAAPGCTGGGEASSMVEDADQSAIEAYEAALAADEAAMNEAPPDEAE